MNLNETHNIDNNSHINIHEKYYMCLYCQYGCNKMNEWKRHVNTNKHLGLIQSDIRSQQVFIKEKPFVCNCGNIYMYQSGLCKHKRSCMFYTKVDKKLQNITNIVNKDNMFRCICSKSYSHQSSMCKHKKLCKIYIDFENKKMAHEKSSELTPIQSSHSPQKPFQETMDKSSNQLFMELIKQNHIIIEQNQEFKNLLLEQTLKSHEISKQQIIVNNNNNITNITTHNTTNNFNLNLFLNEKCKDAISMMDFIDSLHLGTSDIEYTGRHGYVEGITKIFINGLKQLDIHKRPIHCTDLKREILYIKEEQSWEKDDNKTKFKKAINAVVNKNIQQIKPWQDENPQCNILDTNEYILHLNIMRQSLGGGNSEVAEKNNDKIIKNIAKEVIIDKTNYLLD